MLQYDVRLLWRSAGPRDRYSRVVPSRDCQAGMVSCANWTVASPDVADRADFDCGAVSRVTLDHLVYTANPKRTIRPRTLTFYLEFI